MKKPVRLQLSRARGFDLQAVSMAANGLPASRVARPSSWGNPHVVGSPGVPDAETAVALFRPYALRQIAIKPGWVKSLRGRNLACWCKLGEACHADVLLELANT